MKLLAIENFVKYCDSLKIDNSQNMSFSNSYRDSLSIVMSLSTEERYLMNIRSDDDYTDTKTTFYREVLLINNEPAAFIEVDNYDVYKHIGFISIATNPKYRKHGYASMLITRFKNSNIPSHITKLCFAYHKDNEKSKQLALANGFSKPVIGDDGYNTVSLLVSKIKDKNKGLKSIVKQIYTKTQKDRKDPVGNQNCQLCTWCTEAQLRGIKVLPRPVYSPRDIIFSLNGYDIVKNPYKEKISSLKDVINKVIRSGVNSRYYVHVNWKNSGGGHEFIVMNLNNEVYVIDSQANLIEKITSKKGMYYFTDINFNNSFLVRMDDKKINNNILKFNNSNYLLQWDEEKDIEFMKLNNMI